MKKYLSILLLATAMLLQGCFEDEKETNYSIYKKGWRMYSYLEYQNLISKDPAIVAYKLNLLMTTAAHQGTTIYNANKSLESTDNLLEFLFGNNIITDLGNGIYSIKYSYASVTIHDNPREGTVTINTFNKFLQDLEIGEYWDITLSDQYQVGYPSGIDYFYFNVSIPNGYRLTASTINSSTEKEAVKKWTVGTTGLVVKTKNQTNEALYSNWNFQYDILTNYSNLIYSNFVRSTVYLQGEGYGNPHDTQLKFTYKITSPIKYKYGCGYEMITGGTEMVESTELMETQPDYYPEEYVKVSWVVNQVEVKNPDTNEKEWVDSCTYYYIISYAGKSLDFQKGIKN